MKRTGYRAYTAGIHYKTLTAVRDLSFQAVRAQVCSASSTAHISALLSAIRRLSTRGLAVGYMSVRLEST